jgi:hypothetical protein
MNFYITVKFPLNQKPQDPIEVTFLINDSNILLCVHVVSWVLKFSTVDFCSFYVAFQIVYPEKYVLFYLV